MSVDEKYYNKEYYDKYLGTMPYTHGSGWEEIFGRYAARIKKEIAPKRTLDVGCAIGFMVEALHDCGIEAYGIDISEYAISQVRDDIKPFCKVKDATLPIEGKYDLITCIEVLEHLEMEDAVRVIEQICKATDDVIFSSTPFDYSEESHISVNNPERWAELFSYHGFYHDVDYDCSYIAVQAMRFRKRKMSETDIIRLYERKLFMLVQENFAVRNRAQYNAENVEIYKEAYNKHVDMINKELNPKIIELEGKYAEVQNRCEQIKKENITIRENLEAERTTIEIKRRELEQAHVELNIQYEQKMEACQSELEAERIKIENEHKEIVEKTYAEMQLELEKKQNSLLEELNLVRKDLDNEKLLLDEEKEKNKKEYDSLVKQLQKEYENKQNALLNELEEKEKSIEQRKLVLENECRLEIENRIDREKKELRNKYYNQLKEAIEGGKRMEELYYAALNLLNAKTAEYEAELVPHDIRNKGQMEDLIATYIASILGGGVRKLVGEYRKEKKRTKKLLSLEKDYWKDVFDCEFYMNENIDVAEYYKNDKDKILQHFICYGMFEGRRASAFFDVYAYARNNEDVREKYGANIREYYIHYINYGHLENRKCTD